MIVCEVARTFVRQVDGLVVVEVGGQVIEATTEHPFWVVNSGWIAAKDLQVGHMLQTLDGDYLPVEDVCLRPGLVTVYNFEVADAHDYFVSDAEVLVHNNPCQQPSLSETKEALRKVHEKVGKQPKIGDGKGKYGSPMRGDSKRGYRLDPGHTNNGVEKGPHINYWDYTKGKRGSGGIKGVEPIGG